MPRQPNRSSTRHSTTCCTAGGLLIVSTLVLNACRAPDSGVDSWPPMEPERESVLDRSNLVPGQPEHRAPTAPPRELSPRPTPPGPAEPAGEPVPRQPTPHPPGVPGGPGPGSPVPGGVERPESEVRVQPESQPPVQPESQPLRESPPAAPEQPAIPPERGPDRTPAQELRDGQPRQTQERERGMRELFPHVRADLMRRIVEFDGIVPIDVHDPHTPRVYLEVTVCTPDTKEHESLVMTQARPSHVHAALLAMNLKPGKPGGFKWANDTMNTVPPEGDPVVVTFIYRDEAGQQREVPALQWVINAETGEPFVKAAEPSRPPATPEERESGAEEESQRRDDAAPAAQSPVRTERQSGFVFAGSVMRERQGREVYDADGIGTLIGLTTFGAEAIAWRDVISPDSHIHSPEWIADPAQTPPFGTKVTVRIQPAAQPTGND